MKWNLNNKITLGFTIAFLVLTVVGIISYYSLNSFRDLRRNEINKSYRLSVLERLDGNYKILEIAMQRFLTGDSASLPIIRAAGLKSAEDLQTLKGFPGIRDEEVRRLEKQLHLNEELAAKLEEKLQSDFSAQPAWIKDYQMAQQEVYDILNQLKTKEAVNLNSEADEADSNVTYVLFFIILGILMALSFLIGAFLLLNRDIGKRIRTEIVLNRFIIKAEQAQKREEQFLANMSHEIRTPMNAILGMTNLILNTPLEPRQRSYLNAIRQSGENLMVIINEILDFSKINAGKIEFEEVNFNLSDIFYGLYNTFKIKADEKKLKLTPVIDENLPDTIIGDPGKLNQVLVNLIGNSIKFTEKGSVDMICKLVEQDGNDLLIQFSVKDTGIGIPQDKLATIFEDFAQAASDTSRKFGGTGLGLSISKKIVELQGGKIWVESRPGEGTVFSFCLTFKAGTEKIVKKDRSEPVKTQELHGIKILLVEDNEFNQVVAVDTLKSLIKNLKIDIAGNGRIAIEKLKENKKYDVILMDVQMPEMNGYDTTKYIRKHKELGYTDVPVIAMTASATKPEIDRCFDAGMTDFVSKPFDADILLIKISSLINKDKSATSAERVPQGLNQRQNQAEEEADLAFLRQMTSDNHLQMLKYVNMFLESVPEDWDKLKLKTAEGSWTDVAAIAHSMKPRINYMGIRRGTEILKQIELNATAEENLNDVPVLLKQFDHILAISCSQLQSVKEELMSQTEK